MGFLSSLFERGGKFGKKLIEASRSGNTERVKSLLAERTNTNEIDQHGWTALMHASWHGRIGVVKLLLEKGADVHLKDSKGGNAWAYAYGNGHEKIGQLLEKHAAQ